jgi:hypothetical protein
MPPNILRCSPQERQAIFNTHYAARVESGELRVVVDKSRHPARGKPWCTSSEIVIVYDRTTGQQIVVGHRHFRDGQPITRFGLDPKWILHGGVIYSQ